MQRDAAETDGLHPLPYGSERAAPPAAKVVDTQREAPRAGVGYGVRGLPGGGRAQIFPVPAPAVTVAFTVLFASGVYEYGIAATLAPLRTCSVPEFTL